MGISNALIIRGLKVSARAGIRVVAMVVAYLLASGNWLTPAALIQARWIKGLSEWAIGCPATPARRVMTAAPRHGAVRPEPATAAGLGP